VGKIRGISQGDQNLLFMLMLMMILVFVLELGQGRCLDVLDLRLELNETNKTIRYCNSYSNN
jgi:hypothetical protein